MLEQMKAQFTAHKAQLIKGLGALAGAVVGVVVAAALTTEDEWEFQDYPSINDENTEEVPEA